LHGHPNVAKSQLRCSRTEAAGCHVKAPFRTMDMRGFKAYSVLLIKLRVGRHHGASIAALRVARGRRNELMVRLSPKGQVAPVHSYRRLEAVVSNLSGSWWQLSLDETCASYNFDKFSLPRKRRRVLRGRSRGPILQQKSPRDHIRRHVDHKLGMTLVRRSRLFWFQRRR
jgi:hypothetical protein